MTIPTHTTFIFRQSGIALVTVMWLITFLTIVAAGVTVVARSDIQLTRNVVGVAQARSQAEGGIYYALAQLIETSGLKWIGNGSIYRPPVTGMKIEVRIQDEAGRIDINVANAELLKNLFVAAGASIDLAESCADAVMDWRDGDQLRRTRGAEWDDYVAAGRDYAPRNGPFPAVSELRLVLPITKSLFDAVRPALTVYSNAEGVNPALAPRMVLLAISGGDASNVTTYLTNREASPGQLITEGMPQINRDFVEAVGGQVFSISSRATGESGLSASVSAVVSLEPANSPVAFTILSWAQSPASKLSTEDMPL